MRDGLADRPDGAWYLVASTHRIDTWADDPHWLAHECWEFFTDKGAAHELSSYHYRNDMMRDLTQRHVELSRTGTVSRGQQLDAALMALLSDFAPRDTPFYRALIDALQPSADELAERARSLIALLASNDVADVAFAAPTHAGGWIDPIVAVTRLARLGDIEPKPMDLAQLVLRLAPDGRAEALAAARTLDSEAGAVLVRALGGELERPVGPPTLEPAWSAAEQARDPRGHRLGLGTTMDDLPERREHDLLQFPRPNLFGPRPFLRPLLPDVALDSPATLLQLPNVWSFDHAHEHAAPWERWLTTVWLANHDACYRISHDGVHQPTRPAEVVGLGHDDGPSAGAHPIVAPARSS